MVMPRNAVVGAMMRQHHGETDSATTHMSMLQPCAARLGVDLMSMTAAEFADVYEDYTSKWDEFHEKEAAVSDVWAAFNATRHDRPNVRINNAIQVGFAHGLRLNDIHAILGVSWETFIHGFMCTSGQPSRLVTELDQSGWARLEAAIHMYAVTDILTYSNVRAWVRTLGSDVQSYAVKRLVARFGYELR